MALEGIVNRSAKPFGFYRCALALSVFLLLPTAAQALLDRQVNNARYGEALFHFYQDDPFTALTHLMAARSSGHITLDWDETELLLGGLKLSYGLTNSAERIFLHLLEREPAESVRRRAWYYLARIAYQKDRLEQAATALSQMGDALPPELRGKQQLLDALVRMRQGDFSGAAAALEPWQGLPADEPYARYNRGIALVRSDRLDDGAKVLDRLGATRASEAEASALRDKANLAAGQALLETHPREAGHFLRRVRLEGPMSNKALLGAGWAEMVAGEFSAALVPWSELSTRAISDPAVQEAALALPYAFLRLDARERAAGLYREAALKLAAEAGRLDEAMAAVRSGTLLEAALQVDPRDDTLPPVETLPGRAYLGALLASHGFRRALQDYKEIEALQANLRYWQARIDDFDDLLAANRGRFEARMAELDARLAGLELERGRQLPPQLTEELERLMAQRAALALLPGEANKNFRGMAGRIQLMRERVEQLLPRLDAALAQRRALVEMRALQALGARRDSLRSQVTQAQFALAQLYDPAAGRAEGRQ